jgi:hypothetical protein
MMAGGAELENLAHELQREAGDDAELQEAVAVLEQEVKAVAAEPLVVERTAEDVSDEEGTPEG